jgi:hypothetical protein
MGTAGAVPATHHRHSARRSASSGSNGAQDWRFGAVGWTAPAGNAAGAK